METVIERLRKRQNLLTIAETSELLGIHPVTIRDWLRAKKLPAFLVGNKWRLDPNRLADWLLAREVGA